MPSFGTEASSYLQPLMVKDPIILLYYGKTRAEIEAMLMLDYTSLPNLQSFHECAYKPLNFGRNMTDSDNGKHYNPSFTITSASAPS